MKKFLTGRRGAPHQVVWIQTSFLGDIIINTGAFSLLKKHYPKCRQILVTTPVGQKALREQSYLDDVIVFDKRAKSFFTAARAVKRELKQLGIHQPIILQVHKSIRSTLLANYLGGFIISYEEASLSLLSQVSVPRVAVLHECQRQGLLLEPLGISRKEICAAAPTMSYYGEPLYQETKTQRKHVGVSPGSVWGTKRWSAENYGQLVRWLLAEGYLVFLLGSPEERKFANIIVRDNNGAKEIVDLCGRTSLNDLPAIYASLDYLVANDSSPIHYASAFRVPTLAIFGATVKAMGFGPLAPGSIVLERDLDKLPCRPCSDHGPQVCPLKHFRCMTEILVEDAVAGFKDLVTANRPH